MAAAPADPPLPLDRFAEISGELDAGGARDEVLERQGVALEVWQNTQHHWLSQLAAEAARRRYELANVYTKKFLEARKAALARKQTKKKTVVQDAKISEVASPNAPMVVPAATQPHVPLAQGLGVAIGTRGPRLTLAQWAALCAEMACHADRADAIRQSYGFDEGAYEREHAEWQTLFAGDREAFAEYLARFRHYRDWFLGAKAR